MRYSSVLHGCVCGVSSKCTSASLKCPPSAQVRLSSAPQVMVGVSLYSVPQVMVGVSLKCSSSDGGCVSQVFLK